MTVCVCVCSVCTAFLECVREDECDSYLTHWMDPTKGQSLNFNALEDPTSKNPSSCSCGSLGSARSPLVSGSSEGFHFL